MDHESVVSCDNLLTVPKPVLDRYRGSLGPPELRRLKEALVLALELDVLVVASAPSVTSRSGDPTPVTRVSGSLQPSHISRRERVCVRSPSG